MSIVGILFMSNKLKNKAITIYNDNPGAAGAIRTKAPRLYRLDLQYLIRYLAALAVSKKFYFWGVHYTVKDGNEMKIADQLSRFNFDKNDITDNIPIINCASIVNLIFEDLLKHPKNLPKKNDLSYSFRREYNITQR